MNQEITRCGWVTADPLYIKYHDHEWGVPVKDDRLLFEHLCLEAAQAGLSWLTVLKKRENYRRVFHDFDYNKVAKMRQTSVERLLQDTGIIRNRAKISAVLNNAKRFIEIQKEFGSFYAYSLQFLEGQQRQENHWRSLKEVPAITPQSIAMSKDLKKRGFKFVGPTTIYAHMQAIGMVNDHTIDCFRHSEV